MKVVLSDVGFVWVAIEWFSQLLDELFLALLDAED